MEKISIELSDYDRNILLVDYLRKNLSPESFSFIEEGGEFLKDRVFDALVNEAILDVIKTELLEKNCKVK